MLSTTFLKMLPRREAPCPGESARAQHWVGGWGMDPVLVRGFVKFLLLGLQKPKNMGSFDAQGTLSVEVEPHIWN